MQTRWEKIKFLQQLQAGHRKISELLPLEFLFLDMYQGENFMTDRKTGKRYSVAEVETLKKISVNKFFIEGLWSSCFPRPPFGAREEEMQAYMDKIFPSREEDIDLTITNYS